MKCALKSSCPAGYFISGFNLVNVPSIHFLKLREIVDWCMPNLWARSWSNKPRWSFTGIAINSSNLEVHAFCCYHALHVGKQSWKWPLKSGRMAELCRNPLFDHHPWRHPVTIWVFIQPTSSIARGHFQPLEPWMYPNFSFLGLLGLKLLLKVISAILSSTHQ